MMETDGIAAHRLQALQTKDMQRIGQRHADPGMVLMQTDALDLERTPVEKKTKIGIEAQATKTDVARGTVTATA